MKECETALKRILHRNISYSLITNNNPFVYNSAMRCSSSLFLLPNGILHNMRKVVSFQYLLLPLIFSLPVFNSALCACYFYVSCQTKVEKWKSNKCFLYKTAEIFLIQRIHSIVYYYMTQKCGNDIEGKLLMTGWDEKKVKRVEKP